MTSANKLYRCIVPAAAALSGLTAQAQTAAQNYVSTRLPSTPITTDRLDQLTPVKDSVMTAIQYIDGLIPYPINMKLLSSLLILFSASATYAQETLQTVTTRGNVTTTSITSNSGSILPASTGNVAGNFNLFSGIGAPSLSMGVVNTNNSATHWAWLQPAYANSAQTFGFLVLNPLGGNVGIGTNSPKSKLHVGTGLADLISIGITDYGGSTGQALGGVKASEAANGAGGVLEFQTLTWSGTPYALTTKMVIYGNSGNVGIGVPSPQNKLDVNGTIHSKQVLVDLNGWGDYIFKKDYQLLSLSEVKNYIDQNQHLPGIPSEQEMIKKGLDVSEMNKLLMTKVEELTLYVITQDRSIKALNARLKKIESSRKNRKR